MEKSKMTLQDFIEKYWDKQVVDIALRIDGKNSFYVHPAMISGDTINFTVCDNVLETIYECTLPDEQVNI